METGETKQRILLRTAPHVVLSKTRASHTKSESNQVVKEHVGDVCYLLRNAIIKTPPPPTI